MTDTLGCLLTVKVHRANIHDTKAGIFPAVQAYRKYPSIKKFCGDKDYRKTFVANVKSILELDTDISEKIIPKEFKIIPKRWIVERTFAWLNNSRRFSKDYEILTSSEEAMVKISHIYTLLNRL